MKTISEFINVIDSSLANINVDTSIYGIDAINSASYAFTNDYYIFIKHLEGTFVTVIFELKDKASQRNIFEEIKIFINSVIDHQNRLQLERINGKIRDMIVRHAFSPFDLTKEIELL